MSPSWILDRGYPGLARIPTRLPWHVAPVLALEGASERKNFLSWLASKLGEVFPHAARNQLLQWAGAHRAMLAYERLDAMAFDRLGAPGGPLVRMHGEEHVRGALAAGRGFILVLNHFDRLLTAPVALAGRGITTHVLTMPVLDNPELDGAQRRFLMRKIARYTAVTRGSWHTTADGMRPVLESLRRGEGWVILADAWRAEFGRLREHAFLGGYLGLPTGIERLAKSSGAALLHGVTYSQGAACMQVMIEPLPEDPQEAINRVVARLEHDVKERPWAWWHWGLWDQMWRRNVER